MYGKGLNFSIPNDLIFENPDFEILIKSKNQILFLESTIGKQDLMIFENKQSGVVVENPS